MRNILFTGCGGQIGTELTLAFRKIYGENHIIASDISDKVKDDLKNSGPYEILNVLDTKTLAKTIDKYKIDAIVHLAAILSAVGEKNPQLAWDINMNGTRNIFEIGREKNINRILVPSSIAAFGPDTPKDMTPQKTILRPTTMYGVSKVCTELLGAYYNQKYDMDIRGLRYPGVISYKTVPGGGTTDYAVAIYFDAVKHQKYECFLSEDTMLPMIYMPDCLKATTELFQAKKENLTDPTSYNIAAFSVTPKQVAASIKKIIPNFEISYNPDFRQQIADSWPNSIDDREARADWGWKPDFDLDTMSASMIDAIQKL